MIIKMSEGGRVVQGWASVVCMCVCACVCVFVVEYLGTPLIVLGHFVGTPLHK